MSQAISSEWAEHARAVLEQAGHRRGAARSALIELLSQQSCALSAQELERLLNAGEGRTIGRASVYRILDLLMERGLVARLELGDGTVRYELIDPAGEHHHHLLCERCGQILPFDDGDLERSIDRLSRRLGFRVSDHEVVLHGDCAACQH